MLNVVTFMWSKPGYRSHFTTEHVRTMARMVRRHYRGQLARLICFNDLGLNGEDGTQYGVEWRPLWTEHANVPNPHGAHNPSCFRRLKLYSNWAREHIGARIVQIDLDMVLTGDVTPLWDRPEPFAFWIDQLNRHGFVNGAMQLITPGLRDDIWSSFDPARSGEIAKRAGCWGSDQGWLSYNFKSDKAAGSYGMWGAADGCYSWRVHCKPAGGALPEGARVVNFHGAESPWDIPSSDRPVWIDKHYR